MISLNVLHCICRPGLQKRSEKTRSRLSSSDDIPNMKTSRCECFHILASRFVAPDGGAGGSASPFSVYSASQATRFCCDVIDNTMCKTHPSAKAKHEAGTSVRGVFQIFGMARPGTVSTAQTTNFRTKCASTCSLHLNQCSSNFFIRSPPFHSRHVVFAPKPDKPAASEHI